MNFLTNSIYAGCLKVKKKYKRSDRKIDDHDDKQEKQFAEDCFNQLTEKTSSTGCQVNRKNVEASV